MKIVEFNSHKPVLITTFFVLVSFLLTINVLGQQKREPDRGLVANGAYALSNIETINTTNGNLMLNIPLASLPGGPGPGFTYSLRYDSKLWNNKGTRQTDIVNPETGQPEYFNLEEITQSDAGGWQTMSFYKLEITNRLNLEPVETCGIAGPDYQKAAYIYKVRLRFPDGSVHEMRPVASNDYYGDGYFKVDPNGREYAASSTHCTTSSQLTTSGMTYYSTDGSFIRLVVDHVPGNNGVLAEGNTWTLYFPDGGRVVRPLPASQSYVQRIYDRNNNYVSLGTSNGFAEDQFGRVITGSTDSSDPTKQYVVQTGVDGETLTTTIKWKTIWVYRKYDAAFGVTYCYPWRHDEQLLTSIGVVDYIELPEQVGGQRFTFDYNGVGSEPSGTNYTTGVGELKQIVLPSGAYVDYKYAFDGGGTLPGAANLLLNSPTQKDLTYLREYDGSSTQVTDTWLYDIGTYYSIITGPDGGVTTQNFVDPTQVHGLFKGMIYKQVGPDGSVTGRIWTSNAPEGVSYASDVNAWVKYEFTTIPDVSGTPAKTAIKEFSQDKNGNTTEVKEYDFVSYASVPRDSANNPSGLPSNASNYLKRITKTTYYNDTPDSASTTYNDADSYYLSTSPRLLNLAKSAEVQNASGTPQTRGEMTYDYTSYSTNTKAGNLTESKVWDLFKGGQARAYSNPLTSTNSITTSATYNQYGMPLTTTDANGVVTQITYGNVAGPGGPVTDLYPTQTVSAYMTAVARTSSAVYDFYTGLVTRSTDEDNDLTNATEYDDLGRVVKSITAQGTALESWTTTEYRDADRFVVVRSDIETKGDGKKVATQFYDQLGRVRLSKTLEDAATQSATNETDGIKVQTRYQTGNPNSYQLTSNPYRAPTSTAATNELEMGWTRSKSWNTGHKQQIETFSGAALPAPWGSNSTSTGMVTTDIDADRTLVTDQAGKQRISRTNALGQLKDIWEITAQDAATTSVTFPNTSIAYGYQTSYSYDTLNNLTTVNQGVQMRSFSYSSLSRLLSATNPESGTISYVYDPNGNLTSKVDARTITTAYSYDTLNRVTQRSYSGESGYATPTVSYTYDNLTHAIGKLTKVSSSVSTTEYTAFDILGRVTASKQTTDGVTYGNGTTDNLMTYTYNLSGALIEQQYPSGRRVQNTLDTNGDLEMVKSRKNASSGYFAYANNFTYNAAGAVTSMQLGNGKWESIIFNSRLQPTQIALGTVPVGSGAYDKLKLNYDYGTTTNNGNVLSQTITVPTVGTNNGFTAIQTYNYDSLNRLKDATEMLTPHGGSAVQSWKQTFTFDRYGNRNFDEPNTTTLPKNCGTPPNMTVCPADRKIVNPSINTSDNRLSSSEDYAFDNSGNTTEDAEGRIFIYDAENKQVEVRDSQSNVIGQYVYDGDGKRVKKIVPNGETTIFVYDAAGKLVAEYSTVVASEQNAKVAYLTNDHLGSPRINTDQNGAVTARHDYHPFGEEIVTSQRIGSLGYAPDTVRKQFTGYERDSEVNLDFAQARYYSNGLGRFTTTDPLMASAVADYPQTWNRYIYVGNNPLIITDPTGLSWYYNSAEEKYKWFGDKDTVDDGYKPVVGTTGNDESGVGSYVYQSENGTWVTLNPNNSSYVESFTRNAALKKFDGQYACSSCAALFGSAADASATKGRVVAGVGLVGIGVGTGVGAGLYFTGALAGGIVTIDLAGAATGAATTLGAAAAANPGQTAQIVQGISIQFGRVANQVSHAFRHTDALGLNRPDVQSAVTRSVQNIASRIPPGQPYNGIVEVGGQRLQYTAYKLADGTINVGRIHGVK